MSRYRPTNVPSDPQALPQFLDAEHNVIARAIESPADFLACRTLFKEPAKLAEGMIVLADGALWNPGSGSGFYGYRAGAWRFLG
ncbi:hypothetical protein AVMA1855_20010 [Acidovorax sp. SUPP1855]|uniref:hypothetical protein n=1 Tax=Acidovorax sp. SUPP1855 TaxID=431774 RepID=UPI0023DE3E2D|nr:hypothetical protein [Acidovorax sp. SUPP1855]GKS86476.1 hypothetical protein AVMA1855_20010 [Acidovorax sp. SUPP1855]